MSGDKPTKRPIDHLVKVRLDSLSVTKVVKSEIAKIVSKVAHMDRAAHPGKPDLTSKTCHERLSSVSKIESSTL